MIDFIQFEKVTDLMASECPVKVFKHSPVLVSHILIVLSCDPLTIKLLSFENLTDQTPLV